MVKLIEDTKVRSTISTKKMSIGQTGIIVEEDDPYNGVPVMRIYNIESDYDVLLVALNNGNRTWTGIDFKVRLCDFELREI